MSKIVLSEAAQFGVVGAVKRRVEQAKEYSALVDKANRKIEEALFYYTSAAKRASSCLAR